MRQLELEVVIVVASRYENRLLRMNETVRYGDVLKKRGVKRIEQYVTPKFITIPSRLRNLIRYEIVLWQMGDKYFKLANKYYGDPELWWVIASFNLAPTEAHLDIGDTVYVPINWEVIYDYVRG